MPELKFFMDLDELARQVTFIAMSGDDFRYEHELDAIVEFVRTLDAQLGDMDFTRRLHALTTELMGKTSDGVG